MPISLQCPGCGKRLKGGDELAGKKVKCPGCGRQFQFAVQTSSPAQSKATLNPDESQQKVTEQDHSATDPPLRTRWRLYAGGIAALSLVVVAAVAFAIRDSNSDQSFVEIAVAQATTNPTKPDPQQEEARKAGVGRNEYTQPATQHPRVSETTSEEDVSVLTAKLRGIWNASGGTVIGFDGKGKIT